MKMTVLHDWDNAYPEKFDKCWDYLISIIQYDKNMGIIPIIAIHTNIYNKMPNIEEILYKRHPELDIRIHVHVIDNFSHPNRKRLYIPPLNQGMNTWRYDSEYVRDNRLVKLKDGEFPVWHIDYPEYFPKYVEWIEKVKNGEIDLYE